MLGASHTLHLSFSEAEGWTWVGTEVIVKDWWYSSLLRSSALKKESVVVYNISWR